MLMLFGATWTCNISSHFDFEDLSKNLESF